VTKIAGVVSVKIMKESLTFLQIRCSWCYSSTSEICCKLRCLGRFTKFARRRQTSIKFSAIAEEIRLHIKKQSFNDCVLCLILEEELPGISCCMFKSAKKTPSLGVNY